MGHYAYTSLVVTNCMGNRSTVALSLVVVVLLAGCSGFLGGGASGPESPDEFEYAAGYDADGVTNDSEAIESHRNALTNRSSYTVDYQQNVTGPNTNLSYDVLYRVDVEGEEAYHSVDAPSLEYNLAEYHGSDRKVIREVQSGEEQVNEVDSEFAPRELTGVGAIQGLLSNDTDYETSVAERDGTPVVVYETEGPENAATVFGVAAENVTSFSASFAVDSDGVVRTVSYELDTVRDNGEEITVTLEFEVRDLDGTSIDRPDWADDA